MDIEKLTPAPWRATEAHFGAPPLLKDGREPIVGKCQGRGEAKINETNAEFIALARNAFAAQMEYGWTSVRVEKGPWAGAWYVGCMEPEDFSLFMADHQNRFPDPVTALATAYRWKKTKEQCP